MRKIISMIAMMAMALTPMVVVAPATAQPMVIYTCEARSPFATGVWTHYNFDFACRRALNECALRTPAGSACVVTRWWYSL